MSHRHFALLFMVAGVMTHDAALAAVDPASLCQGKKLKAVGVTARDLLRCHNQAALAGRVVSEECLARGAKKLTTAFNWADAKGGCLTMGDAAQVHGALSAGVAGMATMLRPTTAASVCASNKLFAAGRAAVRLLKAFAKERKKSSTERFSHATADFRQHLESAFAAFESVSTDCPTLGDGRAAADRVLAIAGEAALRLWPLSQSGLTVSPPPGLFTDGVLFAMTNGTVLQFRNYGRSQMVPAGGVEITISRLPLPSGTLAEYIEREGHDRQRLVLSPVVIAGHTGTRVVYRDEYDRGMSEKTTIVYVPHGNSLHRFSLVHGWEAPAEGSFTSTFDALLSSVTFVP